MSPPVFSKSEIIAVVSRQLDYYNSRDIEGFCSCYHPEVRVEWLLSKRLISEGLNQFRVRYSELFQNSPTLHCELKSRIVLNDFVIDEELVTGIQSNPEVLHTVAIYGFRDGLIDRVWFPR
jgi:hypothetical protein